MKTILKLFIIFAIMASTAPFSLQARELSLEQVKQNVLNLQKSTMEGQPAVSAKNFKKVIESDNEFVLLDIRSEAEFNAAHHCCNSFIPHGCSNNMSARGEFQVNQRGGRVRTNF